MASSVSTESMPQLSRSEVKCALSEVIRAMNEPNNSQKLMTARFGSDRSQTSNTVEPIIPQMEAIRHMQYVFPMATQILMDVISNYGYSKTGEGVVQFTLAVRHMERFDEDIKKLYTQMKSYFLPKIATTSQLNKSSFV